METKDFALLMLIPAIFIGIVAYAGFKPDITGFAVQDIKHNVMGTYSIMPSFRVETGYSLDEEYTNIKRQLQDAINYCRDNKNIEQCLRQKSNELQWNCNENEDKIVLYDFLNKLKDCMSLKEQNVVCRFSLEQRNFDKGRDFEIRLTDEVKRIKAELMENNRILAADYLSFGNLLYTGYDNKDSEVKTADTIRIVIEFKDKIPNVKEAFAIDSTARIPLSNIFLIYKSKDGIKFTEYPGSSFQASLANTIIDLPRTNGIKFCATSNKQVYAYDSSDNDVKLRNVIYKFAVTLPKPADTQWQNT